MTRLKTDAHIDIQFLAERCVAHVHNRIGFELDYGPDTLPVLDHFIEELVVEEAGGVTPASGDPVRSPLIHLIAPSAGAYFGETLRRQFAVRWRNETLEPMRWALEFEECFLRFNPAGVAADAIAGETVESWNGLFLTSPDLVEPLRERLAVAPPLPEDQFYTFAARYEAIQIAEDYLMERAAKDGPMGCEPHDYDRVFGI